MTNQKIRPPAPNQPQSPLERQHGSGGFKAPDELPEIVRAPDIGGRSAGLTSDEETIDAAAAAAADGGGGGAFVNADGTPFDVERALNPAAAAAARATHGEQNRLGKPFRMNAAERLLVEYEEAKRLYKEAYAGTRNEPEALRTRFLKAREDMIAAGLMKGDP